MLGFHSLVRSVTREPSADSQALADFAFNRLRQEAGTTVLVNTGHHLFWNPKARRHSHVQTGENYPSARSSGLAPR